MTRGINRLTVKEVTAITTPGRHADGGNLYFRGRLAFCILTIEIVGERVGSEG